MDSVVIFPKSVLVLIEDIFYSLKSVVVCYIYFFQDFGKGWQDAYWSVIIE